MNFSLIIVQMIRVISSPSISTTGFATLIFFMNSFLERTGTKGAERRGPAYSIPRKGRKASPQSEPNRPLHRARRRRQVSPGRHVTPRAEMTPILRNPKLRPSQKEGELRPAPALVLVEPQLGENIGAVARAMLNFGLSEMVIVNPRDGWPNEKAAAMASGAGVVLDTALIAATTTEGLAGFNFALAMTARPRESLLPVLTPRAAAEEMKRRIDLGERCAIMLGAERAGLSNEDVARADGVISIPVNPAFASLNIAQAAVVIAYEWAIADGCAPAPADLDQAPQATKEQFEGLIGQLFDALDAARYFYPPEKRETMERKLRTAFARAGLTEGEVRTLRGVVKALGAGRPKD